MEILIVLIILAVAMGLFVTEKFSADFVSLLTLGALLLAGVIGNWTGWIRTDHWITFEEGLSGFANPAVITVAAMFILSEGLQRTGAMTATARLFARLGSRPVVLLIAVIGVVAPVSAFVNNTAAVAVFLPVVLAACAKHKLPPSRYLIPLSYASQFGGVCTLIGTSTNLLVSSISERAGHGAIGMFEFAPLGLVMVVGGSLYLVFAGRWVLPQSRSGGASETEQLADYITELRVLDDSPLIGKNLTESKLGEQHEVTVIELLRGTRKIWSPHGEPFQAGDLLLVRGKAEDLIGLKAAVGLDINPEFKFRDETLRDQELTVITAIVAPRSQLVGRTLAQSDFLRRFDAIVMALRSHSGVQRQKLAHISLDAGDALLLLARKDDLPKLRASRQILLQEEITAPALRSRKAGLALGILVCVIALAALNVMPILVSALLGCLVMIVTGCLTQEEGYAAVDWKVIFLMAGIMPLGIALEHSGAAGAAATFAMKSVGSFGPIGVLAVVYLVTAVLTEFISNAASAVLVAPLAISTAAAMGLDPHPFLIAVTFAASTSFSTPVGYQTNTMVYNAGGYRFSDFPKAGIPLNLLFWLLAVIFIPLIWPFRAK
ncbi:MAG: SLC13 family permease [Chthoniobacteraceae bacterium]